jgi:iron complex outermembrane receptor protein
VGGYWHERNRWGGRVQFLLKPTDRLSLKLNLDGAETRENSNTKPFMVDPTTLADARRAPPPIPRASRAAISVATRR